MNHVAVEVSNTRGAFDDVLIRAIDQAGAVMLFSANETVVTLTD